MTATEAKDKIFELLNRGEYNFFSARDLAIAAGCKDDEAAREFVQTAFNEHTKRKPVPDPKPASEPEPPKPQVRRATVSDEVKAERKAHKLVEDVPATLLLAIAGEWRRYPGMPEVLINVNQIAVVQKTSRRRGTFYRLLPRTAWQGREFWRHSKRGKKTTIPIKRAMFEVGFWQKASRKNHSGRENG